MHSIVLVLTPMRFTKAYRFELIQVVNPFHFYRSPQVSVQPGVMAGSDDSGMRAL
jgi:hypothetical protein